MNVLGTILSCWSAVLMTVMTTVPDIGDLDGGSPECVTAPGKVELPLHSSWTMKELVQNVGEAVPQVRPAGDRRHCGLRLED